MAAGDTAVSLTKNNGILACNFDGSNDEIALGDMSNLRLGDFSLSYWIKYDRKAADGDIIGLVRNEADKFSFELEIRDAAGRTKLTAGNSGGNVQVSWTEMNVDEWEHWAVTFDRDGLAKGYRNGTLLANTGDISGYAANLFTANNFNLGKVAGGTFFRGEFTDLRIYGKVLAQADITKLAAGEDIRTDLIHHWKLKSDYLDSAGVAPILNGTNSGTTFVIADSLIAAAVKTQRTAAGSAGKYMIVKGKGGQVITTAITE